MSDADELTDRVMALLGAAVVRDHEAVKDLVVEIAEQHDVEGVWAMCCVLARTVADAAGVQQGSAAVRVVSKGGGMVNPDRVPTEARPHVWAYRFVAAMANDQEDAALALFQVSFDGDDAAHAADVAALIDLAGGVLRAAERERS